MAEKAREQCKQHEHVHFIAGDMRDFSLGQQFDRVIIPFNGLYCLCTEEEQRVCLSQARKHLKPGGALIFDIYAADEFHEEQLVSKTDRQADYDEWGLIAAIDVRSNSYDVWERSCHDVQAQTLNAEYRFLRSDDQQVVATSSIPQRYLRYSEIEPLLQSAGLRVHRIAHEFSPEQWVVIAGL